MGVNTRYTTFWIRDLITFGGNREEVRGHTNRVSKVDHRETIATDSRRDMEDSQGGSSTGSGNNSVGNDLHRKTTGNHGKAGGITAYI